MTKAIKLLARHQINTNAWNTCVSASAQRVLYGYSWYLDAVLPAPLWKWVGLVLTDETGHYQAVMPVPLRRKQLMGVTCEWVVHQPFFCQFLAIFNRDPAVDSVPFFQIMQQRFRYGSILNISQQAVNPVMVDTLQPMTTHVLDLSAGYDAIYQNYSKDRKINLRRALRANWTVLDASDPEPLLRLFRENHADTIPGGVADWAYAILRNLISELNQRGLATLRYASRDGYIEAGGLFVRGGNRIIYLFNAASEIGRLGNARTLLIDQIIQENAQRCYAGEPVIFDFESPEKPSIRNFYAGFGAAEQCLWRMRWSQLTKTERLLLRARNALKKTSATN